MGLKIVDLLKFRTSVTLVHPETKEAITDDKGNPVVVYLRLIGDQDLEISHKKARLASSLVRAQLKDKSSEVYRDRVEAIIDSSREDCIEVIKSSRTSNIGAEANASVERPELPTLEEVAVDADAPTLEEQETLDAKIAEIEQEYKNNIKEYIDTRTNIIVADLETKSDEELKVIASEEIVAVLALSEFFNELMDQKIYAGAFMDKTYKVKAFEDIEEFKNSNSAIKQQLIDAYIQLELDPDDLKN